MISEDSSVMVVLLYELNMGHNYLVYLNQRVQRWNISKNVFIYWAVECIEKQDSQNKQVKNLDTILHF